MFSAKSSESMGKDAPNPNAVWMGILQKTSSSPNLVKDLHTGSCKVRSWISVTMELMASSSSKDFVSMPELVNLTNVSVVL